MLGDYNVGAIVAVRDINAAEQFYGKKLGLKKIRSDEGGVTYKSGDTTLHLYESTENAGTNKATTAGWQVDDLQAVIDELKGNGVTFEQYDLPGVTREGYIHIAGQEKLAWFKDPDGTIFVVAGADD